jgi:hypothetical protein
MYLFIKTDGFYEVATTPEIPHGLSVLPTHGSCSTWIKLLGACTGEREGERVRRTA